MSQVTAPQIAGDRLHMRIPPDVKDVLREMAEEEGRTVSNWIIKMIRDKAKEREERH